MSALTIGAVEVEVVDFGRGKDHIGGAGLRRAINGTARYAADWRKRVWALSAYAPDDAEAIALRAACAEGDVVVCVGDLLGGSVSVRIEIGDDDYTRVRETWFRTLSLTLTEV